MSQNLIDKLLLNQFRIDAFIASGGMGSVYRVWDLKRNVPLAMKVLHSDLADDPSIFRRFQREAQALQKLKHPNIVPFYGLYQDQGIIFLLEAFIQGSSLQEVLRKGKSLSVNECLIYVKGLCAALGFAHTKGIVHCDVKPGNVLISNQGNIYLADFGIARFVGGTTTTIGAAGSPAYMAPEQITASEITPATDIYALTVMLFEMLTGQRPFRGTEPESLAGGVTLTERIHYCHLRIPAPDPRKLKPDLSSAIAQVIFRGLAKDPGKRFQNTQEFFISLCNAADTSVERISDETTTLLNKPNQPSDHFPVPVYPQVQPTSGKSVIPFLVGGTFLMIFFLAFISLSKANLFPQKFPVNITATEFISTTQVSSNGAGSESLSTDTPIPTNSPSPTSTATATTKNWTQGKITYLARQKQTTNGIYALNLETGVAKPFPIIPTSVGINYSAPLLTADGSKLAFYIWGKGSWVVDDPANGQYRKLNDCTMPSWSGDGQQLVCVNSDGSLQIIDANSGNILETLAVTGSLPFWSPTSRDIVYTKRDGERTSVWFYNLDDKQEILFAGDSTENYAPSWSFDGQWIAFQSNLNSSMSQVWIMDRLGQNARQVTSLGNWSRAPAWSPDGSWLAFVSDAEGSIDADSGEAFVVSLKNGDIQKITSSRGSVYDWRVSWSR